MSNIIRIALVIVGLTLCAWRFWSGVSGAEEIRTEGRTVLLDLRPSDPRELLLGDYMTLNYDALPPSEEDVDEGIAILAEEEGVAVFRRIAKEGEALGSDEFRMRFRRHPSRWRGYTYGGDRYYFQSGTAQRYADAAYGVFKVMPDGRALLSGLADAEKRIIAVSGEAPTENPAEAGP